MALELIIQLFHQYFKHMSTRIYVFLLNWKSVECGKFLQLPDPPSVETRKFAVSKFSSWNNRLEKSCKKSLLSVYTHLYTDHIYLIRHSKTLVLFIYGSIYFITISYRLFWVETPTLLFCMQLIVYWYRKCNTLCTFANNTFFTYV